MSTLLLTGWCGPEFARITPHTLPLMEMYAKRHGMDYQCINSHMDGVPPSWAKVPAISTSLAGRYECVVWIDADVVILESLNNIVSDVDEESWQGLVEHRTECGNVPNCGVWVVRKHMLDTLRRVWARKDAYLNHPWWEQAAIIDLMGYRIEEGGICRRFQETDLYRKTTFLHPKWNHHPRDANAVEPPAFRHVTQYKNRAAVAAVEAAYAL